MEVDLVNELATVFAGILFEEILQILKQAIKNRVSIRRAKHRKKP